MDQQNPSTTVANAQPSKEFFTDTLTRDISLSDCILDLIDNSIHSLVATMQLDVSQHLFSGTQAAKITAMIEIDFDATQFSMRDNCGGISIDDAENHIFLFGNPVKEKSHTGLGVYGIGMKRAFFKIGRIITFKSHTTDEELAIPIDVDSWLKSSDWSFPFSYARKAKRAAGGTDIEITELNPSVHEQFMSKGFVTILREKISRAHGLFIKAGLKISVNGEDTRADIPDLAESPNLRPARQMVKKDGVDILILAGLSPASDKKPRGWYVFCNGRMVLDADKTEQSGWGIDGHRMWHVKYNHFLGYVYFRSKDVRKLPWTTTKEGVHRESPVYQTALAEMWVISRPVLDFLNDLYSDVKEQSEPEHALFKEAKAVAPQLLASRHNSTWAAKIKRQSDDYLVSIQYKRPKKKLNDILKAVGKRMSAVQVGEYTFDWFYDRNCK